ncbi:hypothetical protein LS72_004470 [Helicobacter apodemus]|uniref:Abortive phage infection protein C-terminal domain-containing protein n=1 Tax=Helicobacter apodemus TaxID=135569 RepID=A0A4V6I6N3_9HELI|nr:AIPR family protein [Helicobacter apodemus]TLE16160.1 hypothetical protein LS72_004470 [Helicobacter apodemus]
MESRIVKQAREFCSSLFPEMKLSESQEFEIFSTAMLATTLANKVDNEILKNTWLNDNISGIDGFFIIVDNALYSVSNYNILFVEGVKFKNVEFCFVETKTSKSVDSSAILKFYNILVSILEKSDNCPQYIAQCINAFDDESQKQKNATLKVNFYFCTQKTESDISNLKNNWKETISKNEEKIGEFIEIKTHLIGSEFIRKIYESNRTGQVSISIPKNNLIFISDKCCVGYINALSLLQCISFEDDDLKVLNNNVFEDNIRLFLGDTDINKNIQETVRTKDAFFHLYNNGITIINSEHRNHTNDCTFYSIRIINGCQTISSLFEIYKDNENNKTIANVILPLKLIEAIDEDEIEFIATSANSQNQIDTYQLLSNREFFKTLESYFHKNIINNKVIFYKRRIGQQNKQGCINVDLLIIMRALMSSIFQIPHRASGYFDSTMNKYLESLKQLNKESYCKLIYIITYLFVFVEDYLNAVGKKDKTHLLKHHITFIIFKIINVGIDMEKPKKMGEIPEHWDNETIDKMYNKLKKLVSNSKEFEQNINCILKSIENTKLDVSNITKTNQKILYSPINKVIPDFDNFCSKLSQEIINAKS